MTFSKSKLGRFRISMGTIDKLPDLVKKVMGECVIVRAEMLFELNGIEYTAMSDHFKELTPGERAPYYEVIFSEEADKVRWQFRLEETCRENIEEYSSEA
jgi:hypothetical protein